MCKIEYSDTHKADGTQSQREEPGKARRMVLSQKTNCIAMPRIPYKVDRDIMSIFAIWDTPKDEAKVQENTAQDQPKCTGRVHLRTPSTKTKFFSPKSIPSRPDSSLSGESPKFPHCNLNRDMAQGTERGVLKEEEPNLTANGIRTSTAA